MSVTIECPKCGGVWVTPCEQERAIRQRGKCIACLIDAREPICWLPYEFEVTDAELAMREFDPKI